MGASIRLQERCTFFPPDCGLNFVELRRKIIEKYNLDLNLVSTEHGTIIPFVEIKYQIGNVEIENKFQKNVIIYSHGNACDLFDIIPILKNLSQIAQCNVIGYDYTGYSVSFGQKTKKKKNKPSEEHVYNDLKSLISYYINKNNCSLKKIRLYGKSLGNGPTIHIAAKVFPSIGGIILESSFLSVLKVGQETFPYLASLPSKSIFDNLSKISFIQCKILYIHGKDDDLTPLSHAKLLFNRNPKNSLFCIYNGGHESWISNEKMNHFPPPSTNDMIKKLVVFCNM